jgi:asparagine synthase (glutamine-hydrolysing)
MMLRRGEAQADAVRAMCGTIVHRGPDDEGIHMSGGCGIGMRRLSIIDLSTGHQPIANEDESLWIVFNGEIYDYRDLRQELIGRGHRFRTSSDTETILHTYEEWGTEGFARLRGMFAFAIWDARRNEVTVARDRFGKKPLYYAETEDGLYLASELKALRRVPVPLEVDAEALRFYFHLGYIPEPYSVYKAVRTLEPGTWLRYGREGAVARGRYWQMPEFAGAAGEPGLTEEEAARRVRELFDESVRIRMIADVPLGAFLSGGVDSSLVVASMAMQSANPVKTFSIGFEEAEFNELPYAAAVAERYGTEHHEIVVKPDCVGLVERLVRSFDEPFGDPSAIPTYIVSEFARRTVKVVLSGDGGDEFFGGYWILNELDKIRWADRIPQWMRGALGAVAAGLPHGAYGKNYLHTLSRVTPEDRYLELNYTPYHTRKWLLQPEWMPAAGAEHIEQSLPGRLGKAGGDIISRVMHFEATANLTGDMLVKVDRASMANSLEVRCPLLDHKLAELAASLPESWRRRDGKGKWILLKALGERLDAITLNRPKMGFGVPLRDWFRGELKEYLWDHLTGRAFRERGIVRPEAMRSLLEEHESGRRDQSYWLWRLLMLEAWFEEFGGASGE